MTYCTRCKRSFHTYGALYQHQNNSQKHNMCHRCHKDYTEIEDLREHLASDIRHNICDVCQEDFENENELDEHRRTDHVHCGVCDKWTATNDDMIEHNKDVHNLCVECDHYFSSMNALKNHRKSSRHVSKTVPCIGGRCNEKFIHKAAMLLHIEEGGCKSGATRHTVDQSVAELDQDHFITNPNRIVTGPIQTWATQRAWNGHSFECYFCHREFQALKGLNQHLTSPAHEQPAYRCPPHLNNNCGSQFKTLGALCQHIESESCGVIRFRAVRDKLNSLVQGIEGIAVR
ncbi:hypothetical protein BDV93DRAFT_603385 [Ceratobasidium sp. AG-I]|nr:hypothetical protein BDV93DRAFT_603385 [Ceratobasidium sp. AG-I]